MYTSMTLKKEALVAEEKSKEVSFEKILEQLEKLVSQLERGELPLDTSLKSYETGIGLVREAEKRLEAMEGKIEQLTADGQKKPLELEELKS